MTTTTKKQVCVVIGASHGGVNFAFSLRREGWDGEIILFEIDKELPYHRPPLSKAYLTSEEYSEQTPLFPKENYVLDKIILKLGIAVTKINREEKTLVLNDASIQPYDKLVIATGARPLIPPIQGIDLIKNVFPMRTAEDAMNIKKALIAAPNKQAIIIGGGYVGLETAASLRKLGADVTILEREECVLSRVTAPVMSEFFTQLHKNNGVKLLTKKNVVAVKENGSYATVVCDDGTSLNADFIVIGVGIKVNSELAHDAGIIVQNGIKVDTTTMTNDESIYAIGDCTNHYNPHYKCHLRLESVQNAVDQAKTAAKAICGKSVIYDTIPWFWSDQFDVKLQIVGLSDGYNDIVIRKEKSENSFSAWYFKDEELIAVDAVNFAKAYVLGTKFIKENIKINKSKLADLNNPFKPSSFLA